MTAGADDLDRLVRGIELAARVAGVSRSTIKRRLADGKLKPERHAGRTSPMWFARKKLMLLRMERHVVELMRTIDCNGGDT